MSVTSAMPGDDPYRGTGNPHRRVTARLDGHHVDEAAAHFPTPELKAYYFASAVESASCWPRVLAGMMAQERFHARIRRMMEAILRATVA